MIPFYIHPAQPDPFTVRCPLSTVHQKRLRRADHGSAVPFRADAHFGIPFSGKSADLPDYGLCFLPFLELRFLPLWEESSKEAHEGGERKISPPCDPPLCTPEV